MYTTKIACLYKGDRISKQMKCRATSKTAGISEIFSQKFSQSLNLTFDI